MPASNKNPKRLKDVVKKILKDVEKRSGKPEIKVFCCWPEIVGEKISGHSRPLSYNAKRLFVGVDSPAWINQLSFLKADIIKRIQKEAGLEIKEIIFKLR